MENFDGFKKSDFDTEIEDALSAHMSHYDISPLESANLFPVLIRRQMLKRFLAHTELFKQTLGVPGDVVELGVFRGLGLMTWANLLEAWCIGDRTKTVYGFDNWEGFAELTPEDGAQNPHSHKVPGGFNPQQYSDELRDAIKIFDKDRFIPQKPRVKLIDGDIKETAPGFVAANPGVRLSFIHFDCDLYVPTKAALNAFWPITSRGGMILFDEYGIPDWPGETKAVDEFLSEHPEIRLQTLDWTNAPAAYLIKQ